MVSLTLILSGSIRVLNDYTGIRVCVCVRCRSCRTVVLDTTALVRSLENLGIWDRQRDVGTTRRTSVPKPYKP